ncbi:MAG TPA: hypothetical protein VNC50_13490, partial [Planctomycetia bacterium]|nr:hypothetical protein [Planctomycetia bacterium]
MTGLRKSMFGLAGAALTLSAVVAGLLYAPPPTPVPEVAFVVPASSGADWTSFVRALERAARGAGVATTAHESQVELRSGDRALIVRAYRETGLLGLKDRVEKLGARPVPPLAIAGGSNSATAHALAGALAKRGGDAPLLLVTTGTSDDVVEAYPGRTFRFGHSNSRQARAVVAELKRRLEQTLSVPSQLPVTIVKLCDNRFADNLARRMESELVEAFGADRVQRREVSVSASVAAFADPTAEETKLAEEIAREVEDAPFVARVLVWPASSDGYRRFTAALHRAFGGGRSQEQLARNYLHLLTGDSVDGADFGAGFAPDRARFPTIFFAQVDSRDPSTGAADAQRNDEGIPEEVA